jgi:hypothetical protein
MFIFFEPLTRLSVSFAYSATSLRFNVRTLEQMNDSVYSPIQIQPLAACSARSGAPRPRFMGKVYCKTVRRNLSIMAKNKTWFLYFSVSMPLLLHPQLVTDSQAMVNT